MGEDIYSAIERDGGSGEIRRMRECELPIAMRYFDRSGGYVDGHRQHVMRGNDRAGEELQDIGSHPDVALFDFRGSFRSFRLGILQRT